jgi:uncharacterized iron-regulated membrane protein
MTDSQRRRRFWRKVHRWLGLTLGVLAVVIGITGSALVYETEIDVLLNSDRYAITGAEVALPVSAYLARASDVGADVRPVNVRFPVAARMLPVVVLAQAGGEGAGLVRINLDPPTGRVLGSEAPGGFVGTMRFIHGHLVFPGQRGHEIVGIVGISMLISSLTGLYLWWARRGTFRAALGFRRGLSLMRNVHYVFGFYGCAVLAMLSFTGIFLAYPVAMRSAVNTVMPLSNSQRDVTATAGDADKRISVDEAVTIAREAYPGAQIIRVGIPVVPRAVYTIILNDPRDPVFPVGGNALISVDPSSGAVLRRIDASTRTAGDAFVALQRDLHAGHNLGAIGRAVIAAAGFLPVLFVVTGTILWVRRRKPLRRIAGVSAQP